jgi:MFS family permease
MKSLTGAADNVSRSLVVLMAILIVNGFGYGMIIPLIPIYARILDASSVLVGFIVAAFAVAQTGVSAPGGFLSDRAGRKKVIMLGLALIGIASLLFTRFENPYLFILFRALEGAGGGLIFPSASAYVYDISSSANRGRFMGMFITAHSLGFTVGPFVGGALKDITGDINVPFYGCALMAFSAIVLTHFFLQAHEERKPASRKWEDMKAILAAPGMKPIFFRGFTLMFNNGIMLMAFAIYLKEELDLSTTLVGAVFLVQGTVMLSLTPLGGTLTDRVGRKRPIAFGGALLVMGTLLISTIPYCSDRYSFSGPMTNIAPVEFWFAALFVAIRGTGIGFNNPAAMSLITETCPEGKKGSAMGTYGSVAGIGLIFGPITAGFLYGMNRAFPFYAGAVMTTISVLVLIILVKETFRGSRFGGGEKSDKNGEGSDNVDTPPVPLPEVLPNE